MNVFRTRSILLWIVISTLILSLSGGVFTIFITQKINSDAELINRLGIIRGSIQRLVKLELAGVKSDELLNNIDSSINAFTGESNLAYDGNEKVHKALDTLSKTWLLLKESIAKYKGDSSTENKSLLLRISEEIWAESNEMVLSSQLVSENRVKGNKIILIFSTINILLGMVVIFLVQRYVGKKLGHLARFDGLTELYNRRYFNEVLDREISKSARFNTKFSIVIFDIDHFKKINDVFGHDVGDTVLKLLSEIIKNNIRKSDVFARIGGDEFAVIAPETRINKAVKLTEKIHKAVEKYPFKTVGKITISLGATEFKNGDTDNSIFKRADKALYRAKNNGRNRAEKV